jgi:GH35 family endo-1,4-beta-xylanase
MIRRTLVAVAATVAVAASLAPATAAVKPVFPPPKAKWQKVDSTLFGMHVASVSAGKKFPGRLGGVRLWDNGVRWDQIETSRGEFDWERLDTAVATAEQAGAREITYILGSTPEWAAKYVRPDKYYYGGGTASEPKKLKYWRQWVRAVATRYKGRITSYQIWNEANLAAFYAPERPKHWKRMALLTDIAADEIRAIDRKAKIVSASSTVIQGKKFTTESFFFRYLRSIRNRKVKLDAIGVHLYPWTTKGPGGGTPTERLEGLALARKVTSRLGLAKVPMWDTEVNYGNRRDNGHATEVFKPKVGAAYLARTYVDSLRYDVTKVFWYSWESHVMGISTTDEITGEPVAPGRAFFTIQDWLDGAKWGTCSDQRVTVCSLKRKGERQYLLYARLGTTRKVRLPKKSFDVREVCSLDGTCERIKKRTVRVKQAPVLLVP